MKTRHFAAAAAFFVGVALTIGAGVYAQSGYPTVARFLRIGVGTAPPAVNGSINISGTGGSAPRITFDDTAGTGNSALRFNDAGVARGFVCMANAAGQCTIASNEGDLTMRVEGGARFLWTGDGGTTTFDMTPSSGTFTASYTNACTTTPTQSIRWYKVGNLVTMTAAAAISCTGDTTTFDTDATDIPAAIRPSTSNVYSAGFGANNNGASATAQIELQGGEIVVNRCGAVTGTCDGGAWTGAGTRGLDAWTLSYIL